MSLRDILLRAKEDEISKANEIDFMHGTVSILDDEHYALIMDLWAELEVKFGVKGLYKTPFPHFSYHVASQYNFPILERVLRNQAASSHSFEVETAGLAIFTGSHPVLYVPVVKNRVVLEYHQKVWSEIDKVSSQSLAYYQPQHWVPHITLADGEMLNQHLPDIIAYLSGGNFNWKIKIANLAVIEDKGASQEVRLQLPFA